MSGMVRQRRLPVGAEVLPGGGVHFRVWAPKHDLVEVSWEAGDEGEGRVERLTPEGGGYHSGEVAGARAGTRYQYRVGGKLLADPASRFQPDGPHGPSQVVDPSTFAWTDDAWRGVKPENRVIYEMHVGTFTREGTWHAAARELE